MVEKTKRFIVIDGNAIIHRAYHAIPPLTTKKGEMVNAVYGFVSMLLRVWRELKPDYVAVTFDVAGKTFRHEKFDGYKAKRVKAEQALYDQIPLVHEVVGAFGIPIYEKSGYEADDVIGTIVNSIKNQVSGIKKVETYIVTGDMDTLQLVNEYTKVYTLRKGISDIIIYDEKAVQERFGFGPERLVEYKALRGDPSDNIPGVPGIGEKTAQELIQKFGTIEEVFKQIERGGVGVKPGVLKKLEEGRESAKMSRCLATIDCEVPDLDFNIEKCKVGPFDREKIVQLFQRFEFVSLLKRIPELSEQGAPSFPLSEGGSSVGGKGVGVVHQQRNRKKDAVFEFKEIKNNDEIERVKNSIKENKQFFCKAFVSGKDIFTNNFLGILIIVADKAFYIIEKYFEEFKEVFHHEEAELIGHDIKQFVKIMKIKDPKLKISNKLFDVMVASYLLNPGTRAHDSESIILKVLGQEAPLNTKQESLFGVDPRVEAEEAYLLNKCAITLKAELIKTNDYALMKDIEMPLVHVLADMELVGVAVDTQALQELSQKIHKQIQKVTKDIYGLAGAEFNISSPIQLREILFEKMSIPINGIKKGKTGLSTSAESLEKLRGVHPIIEKVEEYREICKLQNTYIDVLPTLINSKTGRIHAKFNQAVTATGRLSSSDPNLQNIPIRTELGKEIRNAFVAEKGNLLVSADYSQLELRIVASLAEDKKMIDIFENGLDIHTATAAAINGVALERVTKQMRYAAKEVNFGVLYGMGVHGLAWRAGISRDEAKNFIKKYFEEFRGVKKYIDTVIAAVRQRGYCETLFGRRRYIPEINSSNFQARSQAERMAINHPIQGTEADMIKMAMIELQSKIINQESGIKMIMQVHDELVFEIKKELVKHVLQPIKQIMESVVKLRVPVKVEVSSGENWGEVH